MGKNKFKFEFHNDILFVDNCVGGFVRVGCNEFNFNLSIQIRWFVDKIPNIILITNKSWSIKYKIMV